MTRRGGGLALAAALAAATPVAAQEAFAGLFSHGARIGITACCYEPGPDAEIGLRTAPVWTLSRWGSFRFYGLGSINTRGGVSFGSAGLAWRIPLGGRFYLQPGLGAAVQNGPVDKFQKTPDRLYLGSRVLFQPEGALGYQLSARWALEASYVHLSHAHLAGPQNPGLDDLGLRVVYRFGG